MAAGSKRVSKRAGHGVDSLRRVGCDECRPLPASVMVSNVELGRWSSVRSDLAAHFFTHRGRRLAVS